ncbi:MAG: hypothetical protein ACXWKY_06735 [Caulobacteraceae bacterium]
MHQFQILLVDDQTGDGQGPAAAFAGLDCRVLTVATVREALAALTVHRFDMVCLDPRDPATDKVLARLAPDQYALAWRSGLTRLPARFDGVLARSVSPILAAVTIAVARMTAASRRNAQPEHSAAA